MEANDDNADAHGAENNPESEEATGGIEGLLPHLDSVFIPTSDQMVNPIGMQQQLNRNPAPSSPLNPSQQLPEDPFGQQSRLSTNAAPFIPQQLRLSTNAAPFIPQTTSHHLPVANQFPNLAPVQNQMMVPGPIFLVPNDAPWNPHNTSQQLLPPYLMADPQKNLYPPPMANPQNPYTPSMAYLNPYPPPMAYPQNPYPPPMANPQDPYTPPMAYLQNLYPPPMANTMMPRFRSDERIRMITPRGQPRPVAGVRNYYNSQQQSFLPEPNHQQYQQPLPQLQQSAQSQGFDAEASSDQGHDHQQPR